MYNLCSKMRKHCSNFHNEVVRRSYKLELLYYYYFFGHETNENRAFIIALQW